MAVENAVESIDVMVPLEKCKIPLNDIINKKQEGIREKFILCMKEWSMRREETMVKLQVIYLKLDALEEKSTLHSSIGKSVYIAGGMTVIVSAALLPFTLGLSSAGVVGGAIAGLSTVASSSTAKIIEHRKVGLLLDEVVEALKCDHEAHRYLIGTFLSGFIGKILKIKNPKEPEDTKTEEKCSKFINFIDPLSDGKKSKGGRYDSEFISKSKNVDRDCFPAPADKNSFHSIFSPSKTGEYAPLIEEFHRDLIPDDNHSKEFDMDGVKKMNKATKKSASKKRISKRMLKYNRDISDMVNPLLSDGNMHTDEIIELTDLFLRMKLEYKHVHNLHTTRREFCSWSRGGGKCDGCCGCTKVKPKSIEILKYVVEDLIIAYNKETALLQDSVMDGITLK